MSGGEFARKPNASFVPRPGACEFFDEPAESASTASDFTAGPVDPIAASAAFGHFGEDHKPFGDLVPKLKDPSKAFPELAHPTITIPPLTPSGHPALQPTPKLVPPTPPERLRIPSWVPLIGGKDLDGRNDAKQPPANTPPSGQVTDRPTDRGEPPRTPGTTIGPMGPSKEFDENELIKEAGKNRGKTATPKAPSLPFVDLIKGLLDVPRQYRQEKERKRTNEYIEQQRKQGNHIHNEDLPGGRAPEEESTWSKIKNGYKSAKKSVGGVIDGISSFGSKVMGWLTPNEKKAERAKKVPRTTKAPNAPKTKGPAPRTGPSSAPSSAPVAPTGATGATAASGPSSEPASGEDLAEQLQMPEPEGPGSDRL